MKKDWDHQGNNIVSVSIGGRINWMVNKEGLVEAVDYAERTNHVSGTFRIAVYLLDYY